MIVLFYLRIIRIVIIRIFIIEVNKIKKKLNYLENIVHTNITIHAHLDYHSKEGRNFHLAIK